MGPEKCCEWGIPLARTVRVEHSRCLIYLSDVIDQNRCTLLLQVRAYTIYNTKNVCILMMNDSNGMSNVLVAMLFGCCLSVKVTYSQLDFTSLRSS